MLVLAPSANNAKIKGSSMYLNIVNIYYYLKHFFLVFPGVVLTACTYLLIQLMVEVESTWPSVDSHLKSRIKALLGPWKTIIPIRDTGVFEIPIRDITF